MNEREYWEINKHKISFPFIYSIGLSDRIRTVNSDLEGKTWDVSPYIRCDELESFIEHRVQALVLDAVKQKIAFKGESKCGELSKL